jgi:hypothetical protein
MEILELSQTIEYFPSETVNVPADLLLRIEEIRGKLYFDSKESTLRYLLNNALQLEGV